MKHTFPTLVSARAPLFLTPPPFFKQRSIKHNDPETVAASGNPDFGGREREVAMFSLLARLHVSLTSLSGGRDQDESCSFSYGLLGNRSF